MISFKKIILSFVTILITAFPIANINSCSKIKQKEPDVKIKFNWDESKSLSVGKLADIKISNYSDLLKKELTDNMNISIDGDSVKVVKNEKNNSYINAGSFNLNGIKEGLSTVTVSSTSIMHLKVSVGSFKINVIDYSKINVNYNKNVNEKNPFIINGLVNIDLGYFDPKIWAMFSFELKNSLKVIVNNVTDEKHDSILDILSFKINNDGKITAKIKPNKKKWESLAKFHINIEDTQNLTNFKDVGYDFWLDHLAPQTNLEIQSPGDISIPYNGRKNDYKKELVTDDIIFKVKAKFDFKWASDAAIKDVLDNGITSTSSDSSVITKYDLIADAENNQFKLKIHYKEMSFDRIAFNVSFRFSANETVYTDSVDFAINKHRHGVIETDNDSSKREIKVKYDNNSSYDFIKDSRIDAKKLINSFEIKPNISDQITSNIKLNGYDYINSVVLTKESFEKNLSSLELKDNEDEGEIKIINDKIQQIDISTAEKDFQSDTGITLNADFSNDILTLKCSGIVLDKDNNYKAGEYYIINKYKDNKANYQFSYINFKWIEGNINFNSSPIKIISHLYSMPIKNNSDIKTNFNDIRAGDERFFGKDTGAGTIDNPLMLTENDTEVYEPNQSSSFAQNNYENNNGNRGYLLVDNIKDENQLKGIKITTDDGNSFVKFNEQKPISKPFFNDKYFINMTLLGQKNRDLKPGKFTLNISGPNIIDYSFTIYYAAYIGAPSTAGDFVADGFIDTPTSIFVAPSAGNRELFLGISSKSSGSIKDVFIDNGYYYFGSQGPVTTDVCANKNEPEILRSVSNLTFGGGITPEGSFVFMASPNSGVEGYITFCDTVCLRSKNDYISSSNRSDDPGFSNSAILLAGNLRNKPSSPIIGRKGIYFSSFSFLSVCSDSSKKRDTSSISVIATSKKTVLGKLLFEQGFELNEVNIPFGSISLITNEIIPADANVLPDQIFGDITVKGHFSLSHAKNIVDSELIGLVVDKNAFNPHSINNSNEFASIHVDNFYPAPSRVKRNDGNEIRESFILLSDSTASGSDISYISTLPIISVSEPQYSSGEDYNKNLKLMLAKGRYNTNQKGYIVYTDKNKNERSYNFSSLNDFYSDYTEIS